jgi:hypothetical protein
MALDVPLQAILDIVGHDGSEIIWPRLPEPLRRRSFHIQEMIHICRKAGYAVTPFEGEACLAQSGEQPYRIDLKSQFEEVLLTCLRGVITGRGKRGNIPHAVAWNGSKVYCPSGEVYGIEEFTIDTLWVIS